MGWGVKLRQIVDNQDASPPKLRCITGSNVLNALSFHFRHVLDDPFGDLGDFRKSKRPRKLPVVLSRDEVRLLLDALDGPHRLPAALLYGGGLRLLEALRLRIKDIDLDRRRILVCDGKGQKDRITVLPDRRIA